MTLGLCWAADACIESTAVLDGGDRRAGYGSVRTHADRQPGITKIIRQNNIIYGSFWGENANDKRDEYAV